MSATNLSALWPWMMRLLPGPREARLPIPSDSTADASPRMYRVQIDMTQLRSHIKPLRRTAVNDAVLNKWLLRSGFKPQGDWWIVPEPRLAQLAPSELIASEPLN